MVSLSKVTTSHALIFWSMSKILWQYRGNIIVIICNLFERSKQNMGKYYFKHIFWLARSFWKRSSRFLVSTKTIKHHPRALNVWSSCWWVHFFYSCCGGKQAHLVISIRSVSVSMRLQLVWLPYSVNSAAGNKHVWSYMYF